MRCSEPGHRVTVAIERPVGRVAELGSLGTLKSWQDRNGWYMLLQVHTGESGIVMKAQPRYSKEEFARRGDAIYESELRPVLEKGDEGKFVAIDIETGAYQTRR